MTPQEHIKQAERILAEYKRAKSSPGHSTERDALPLAQLHASLAIAKSSVTPIWVTNFDPAP